MGAWGTGPFENDGALDLVGDISSLEFSWEDIEEAFEDPAYLEADGGQYAIALGALVRIVQGEPAPEAPEDARLTVIARHLTPERVAWIRTQVARTLSSAKESELYELWEETSELEEWLEASRGSIPSAT